MSICCAQATRASTYAGAHHNGLACLRNTAKAAYGAVEIPEGVIDLLTGLRDYLQDKCEPPVYVSDRRFMKSIQMLQVAAFADGRDSVSALSPPSKHCRRPLQHGM